MWMDTQRVAEAFFLNAEKLEAFANRPGHAVKYHLDVGPHGVMVGTWHSDRFVRDFKASQAPEVLLADREAALDRYRSQLGLKGH